VPVGTIINNGKGYVAYKTSKGIDFADSPQEADKAVAKDAFMKSGEKKMEYEGELWINRNGEFSSQSKAKVDLNNSKAKYNLEMDRAQARNDLYGWAEQADKKIQAIDAYIQTLDPEIDQDEIDSLTLEKENLIDKAEKYADQGGFKKAKKVKKISLNLPTSIPRPTVGRTLLSGGVSRNMKRNITLESINLLGGKSGAGRLKTTAGGSRRMG